MRAAGSHKSSLSAARSNHTHIFLYKNPIMMKLFVVMVVMMMAVSTVSAADPPTPAPMSDATTVFVPTAIASLSTLVFAFIF
ncbi:hypothetical protein L6452_29716 [Arctium lappa]|uniref:Uncharacterized protein n=1 Tax=Arctium lappa TaxID=4217 RepID=A0ACB8ZHG5_ARCLA|nr:hypothetical protein L6452_29716 [Arctium lappa]